MDYLTNIEPIVLLGFFAGALELVAKYLVGNKNKYGFIVHLIAGGIWTYIACQIRVIPGLLVITLPGIIINIRNFRKWHKEK